MINLQEIFDRFNQKKVLIIGDIMLDTYLWGNVERISPEAPVPIVNVHKKEARLGGAANVALNIAALGAMPIICSVLGNDAEAEVFKDLAAQNNINTDAIIHSSNRPTTVKNRIIGHHQHILRIDFEVDTAILKAETEALFLKISAIIDAEKIDVIIFEDYDKGVITPELIEKVVAKAKSQNIPTVVDPKKRNFMAYKGVSLFKPNLKELREGLKVEIETGNIAQLSKAVAELIEKLNINTAMITLSEHGVFIKNASSEHHIPAHIRNISDVSGAGDTVVSVAALALAAGCTEKYIAGLANLAGGLVCEKVGVVPINKAELLAEALKYSADF